MNALEGLSRHTTVVADTGDVALIAHHRPQDATTNPSLILKAVGLDDYKHWIQDIAAEAGRVNHSLEDRLDALLVKFGKAILEVIPGRVSTEIDARLSFDAQASFKRAMHIAERYHALGVHRDRFLIKIAATWEGIEAAGRLEREGVHCNLTLVFSLTQSIACAEAGVRLISPFVGRIYDWYQKNSSKIRCWSQSFMRLSIVILKELTFSTIFFRELNHLVAKTIEYIKHWSSKTSE